MKKIAVLVMIAVIPLLGCIRNDIPFPVIVAGFESMSVPSAESVSIDAQKRRVDIVLKEVSDIHKVEVKDVVYTDPSVKASWNIEGVHDLSRPVRITLSTFDDYEWTVSATQPIKRWFTVSSQVGESVIDVRNCRVIAKVSSSADLKNLSITSCKLGPESITAYTPEVSTIKDFTNVQSLLVVYGDTKEIWNIYVEKSTSSVRMTRTDAWTKVVWLSAEGVSGQKNGFKYREKGTSQWTDAIGVEEEGGSFSVKVDGLKPLTEYECIAYSGKDETDPVAFRTEAEVPIPNSGFEVYSKAESSKYYSFYDPDSAVPTLNTKWWDSGNKGSTTVGSSYTITMPDTSDKVEGESSLLMASTYVIVKFAAGNVFSGEFGRTIGTTGGTVRLGRPFSARPQKLSFWVKYKAGIITEKTFGGAPDGDPVRPGDRDRGTLWVALGDWDYHKYGGTADSPVEINTTDRSTFFNASGSNVIAYGQFVADKDIDEWTKVEIPLEYNSTSRKPTHIIISAASSMLGDYFTGAAGSKMWIDDIRLEY